MLWRYRHFQQYNSYIVAISFTCGGIRSTQRKTTKFYDKKDYFNFPIVNFPFICNNIPVAPVYGLYISQLIRYSRACGCDHDVLDIGLLLTRKLLNQGFLVKLKSSLRKFYGRHHDFGINVIEYLCHK